MHGQYRYLMEKPPVDMKDTYRWLKSSNLSAATERLVVTAQDHALRTRYDERNILHRDVSPNCHNKKCHMIDLSAEFKAPQFKKIADGRDVI